MKMSRKSLSKKDTAIWYQCNSCNWNILANDREQHLCNESCEIVSKRYTFVADKKLSTNQLSEKPITDDLRGISSNKLNNLIFLHESIFPLCDLVLGDYVIVTSSELPGSTPVIRNAWPNSKQTSGIVCVSTEG